MSDRKAGGCLSTLLLVLAAFKACLMFLVMLIAAGFVSCFRCAHRCCGVRFNKIDPVLYEDWFSFNLNLSALRTMIRDNHADLCCSLRKGSLAPDLKLVTLEGLETRLSDFQTAGRPLVINFGSCS
ncbi:hypothetical protein DPMN_054759 [Dreissena polymorpha]|uniref:Iodothyronine deiodinase n=1 Tax=Dreissena polymorpha TaxID=45954 RepID=A0A9D4CQG7_DREPO|nr:hypothetical protein DPMN_054759 [Dreissena polymorpha]